MTPILAHGLAALTFEPRLSRVASNLIAVQFPLMKLAPAHALVSDAPTGAGLIESTSGTMGLALATMAAARGVPLTLVTPALPALFKAHLEALGQTAVIEVLGDQTARLERLHLELANRPSLHWTEQYANPLVPLAYRPIGHALIKFDVGALVVAVGSGGSAMGLIRPMRETSHRVRLIAVDAVNSVLFGRPDGSRQVPGIGNSLLPAHLNHALVDTVHWMGDDVLTSEARCLARHTGLFAGPTGAGALKVARWHAAHDRSTNYAAILPDEGHRYLESVFRGGPERNPQSPLELDVEDAQRLAPPFADAGLWLTAEWGRRNLPANRVFS